MTSPTRWTWVWEDSGSWWWMGRSGVLRFMGSQRAGHDWVTELNCSLKLCFNIWYTTNIQCSSPCVRQGPSHHHTCPLGLMFIHSLIRSFSHSSIYSTNVLSVPGPGPSVRDTVGNTACTCLPVRSGWETEKWVNKVKFPCPSTTCPQSLRGVMRTPSLCSPRRPDALIGFNSL